VVSAESPPVAKLGNTILTPRVISLERKQAWELLRLHVGDDQGLLATLKSMIADKSAVLEYLATLVAKPGHRVESKAVREYHYPSVFAPPTQASGGKLAEPTAFESRALGFHCEAESSLSKDGGIIDLNIAFEFVGLVGNLTDPLLSERYPEQPVFVSQKFMTSVSQRTGHTQLLSTLNPPGETGVNGRKDEGRVWLLFMEGSVE
jgi:hypothetical protein